MGLIPQPEALHADFSENWGVSLIYIVNPHPTYSDMEEFMDRLDELEEGTNTDIEYVASSVNHVGEHWGVWFNYDTNGTQEDVVTKCLALSHSLLVAARVRVTYLERFSMSIVEIENALLEAGGLSTAPSEESPDIDAFIAGLLRVAEADIDTPELDVTKQARVILSSLI